MTYLVIIVLVAVLGITRLWLQQRREQSQLDTIEGFSSALEAIKPEMPAARLRRSAEPKKRRGRPAARARRAGPHRRSAPKVVRSLVSWFVTTPDAERIQRAEARRRIEAGRVQREAARREARRSYRPTAPRHRDIAFEPIDLTDDRPRRPVRRERVSVPAAQMSYSSRYREHLG